VPMLLGLYARQRQDLIDTLRAQSENAARQRALEAERIRAEERSRLANEIHDVVAHSVSLMIVHSGALKLAAPDERTREIAERIRNAGRMALEELRDLVGVLRHGDSAPLGPAPNLANLGGLTEDARTAGTPIEMHLKGTPRRVSGAVERTAYRVVQEALTNARKHAAGAPVRVDVIWRKSDLDIAVRNDPPPAGAAMAFPDSGYGIESLRERVNLLSGVFRSGPTNEGGWRVYASLPTGGGGEP
jgi:signal transduction histidine kinase